MRFGGLGSRTLHFSANSPRSTMAIDCAHLTKQIFKWQTMLKVHNCLHSCLSVSIILYNCLHNSLGGSIFADTGGTALADALRHNTTLTSLEYFRSLHMTCACIVSYWATAVPFEPLDVFIYWISCVCSSRLCLKSYYQMRAAGQIHFAVATSMTSMLTDKI